MGGAPAAAAFDQFRRSRWQGLLLSLLPLLCLTMLPGIATAAAAPQNDSILGPPLAQVVNWSWTPDGSAPRGHDNVFCANSIGTITAPTAFAARALEALCDLTGPQYFSGSALDAFLAGRFAGNYSFGTAGLPDPERLSPNPYSTEPNIPWMLADYVITLSETQARADSRKQVMSEAQVDVLLCLDPTFKVLVDLQNVSASIGERGARAAAFSGFSSILRLGVATINRTMSSSLHSKDQWMPSELKRLINGSGTANVQEVAWHVENPFIIGEHATDRHAIGFLTCFPSPTLQG